MQCVSPQVKALALHDVVCNVCVSPQVKALALHDELFSVENGFLTPTFKTKRPAIKAAFMETFVRLYQTIC